MNQGSAMDAQLSATVSARILAAMQRGQTVREAITAVCGPGKLEAMLGALYDEFNAKPGQ